MPLSRERRQALLDWAREAGAWIVEDDYDSEYRYAGRPLPALQGDDGAADRVIYCGTFSKVLTPALRLAYAVVPRGLLEAFVAAKAFADVQCPALEQAVLSDFIAQGHFARHIRRTRVLYAKRQALLIRQAARELAGLLDVRPMDAGMHLIGELPAGADDRAVSRRAREAGVEALPLSAFATKAKVPPALLLGYAVVPEGRIVEGVRRLGEVLRE
jgi:GntR family transcriptional regulator/MocR family aminotransferase